MPFGCPKHLEVYRLRDSAVIAMYGDAGDQQNGVLLLRHKGLMVIFSCGDGWEHVSVSRRSRCPSYEDMCWAKEQFWDDDQCAMQLHVPKADHVNCHPYCLHLWRPLEAEIPRPPAIHVGPPTSAEKEQ